MKRSSRISRDGEYTKMPAWLVEQSTRARCEVCGQKYGTINGNFVLTKQVIDHQWPVRFLLTLGLDPHLTVNTVSCCSGCHGRKLRCETLIFAGDLFGFLSGLLKIGYPLERIIASGKHYGFKEVAKFDDDQKKESPISR